MKTILIGGNSHPGMRRKENEDTFTCKQLWSPDKALLVVVDGVGGYAGGEKAAAIARDSIDQYMQTPKGDTLTMLREAVIFANNRIAEERRKDPRYGEMCCVLTAAVADAAADVVYFAHVGDTRLYRFRKGSLEKLTKDHSFVGIREDAGEISEHEAMNHPQRNQILREVGSAIHRIDDEDFIEYGREELLPGDYLLLCSDGLTDMVTVKQITGVLATNVALATKVNNLISLANDMGGHDNITIVLLKNNKVKQQASGTRVKKAAKPKTGTNGAQLLIQDEKKEKPLPVATPVQQPAVVEKAAPAKKTANTGKWITWNFVVIVLLAVCSWFFFSQRDTGPATDNNNNNSTANTTVPAITDTTHKKSTTIFSGQHAAVAGPATEAVPDTLRLSTAKNITAIQQYTDSTGKALVLLPVKEKGNHITALEINKSSGKPGDTMVIKNIHLKGFETGIRVSIPVHIRLENMFFENVKFPVSYQYKTDSINNSRSVQMTNTVLQ
jgi:serine/threonine protein phosphatase PrpC